MRYFYPWVFFPGDPDLSGGQEIHVIKRFENLSFLGQC